MAQVLRRCGPPTHRDRGIEDRRSVSPSGRVSRTQVTVDEWTYDLGPGSLIAASLLTGVERGAGYLSAASHASPPSSSRTPGAYARGGHDRATTTEAARKHVGWSSQARASSTCARPKSSRLGTSRARSTSGFRTSIVAWESSRRRIGRSSSTAGTELEAARQLGCSRAQDTPRSTTSALEHLTNLGSVHRACLHPATERITIAARPQPAFHPLSK